MVGFLEWGHDMHSRVLLENDSRAVGPASGTPLHASPSKWTLQWETATEIKSVFAHFGLENGSSGAGKKNMMSVLQREAGLFWTIPIRRFFVFLSILRNALCSIWPA